jgi:hypothetical protein
MTSRPLTVGEIALARGIFGDSIDYAAVSIFDSKFTGFHPSGTAMAPNGNLYMPGCYRDDYAQEDVFYKSTFLHEMTHVWQYQNKVLNPIAEALKLALKHKFNYNAAYAYTLDEKKDLLDYNMEQQASIVQDYFVLKREGASLPWGNCMNEATDAEKTRLFEKVLGKFHADPLYARKKPPGGSPPKRPAGPPAT